MSIITKISKLKRDEDRRHNALSAVAAITHLDPDAREDLISYLKALHRAIADGNQEEQEYLLKAILEVFEIDGGEDAPDVEDWEKEVRSSSAGRKAGEALDAETVQFFKAYQRCKAHSRLTTIRKVADAAGISPTTVQAIEKKRVKPQFRTIQALAKAFRVDPAQLNEGKA